MNKKEMELSLPRILIIDDIFGSSPMDRRNLCRNFGLIDVTGDDKKSMKIEEPVTETVFCSGQIRKGKSVKNDVGVAVEAVQKGWDQRAEKRWALVLLDLRFVSGQIRDDGEPEGQSGDDSFGLKILEALRKQFHDLPVIIISSRERAEVIEECRKLGALDFIQRHEYGTETLTPRELLRNKILEHGLIEDNRIIENEKYRIIGESLPMLKVLRAARRGATGTGNILILGETGTGKELLARYIHDISPKSSGPYKIFHPFGTTETLQEDEIFGHVKGAFTGATSDKEGLFELSNEGTIFIDEIGDIPENLQLKLLRPLENKVVKRQGGSDEIHIDVQVVLATNKNLEKYSKTGKFKSDLLNRINAYTVTIPPLNERKDDIPSITAKLLENLCKENNARWPRKILPETMEILKNHEWHDNVRGLRNVLERAIKDNKDSELLVSSDVRFDTAQPSVKSEISAKEDLPATVESINQLISVIESFEFPKDYGMIQGKLPDLQSAIAKMLANYLQSSLEVTKKNRPGTAENGEINITGAVSCMVGEQLKTPKAADLIKKMLQQNGSVLEKLIKETPLLEKAYSDALRLRPKRPEK